MKAQQLISRWEQVRTGLLTTIEKFSPSELDYVPVKDGYSVAQLILHIAHEEEGEVRYGTTHELAEWPAAFTREAYPSFASIKALFAEVHTRTERFLGTLTDADLEREITTPWGQTATMSDLLWHVLEHEIHHRGELSLTLGLLGHQGLDA